MSIPHWPPQLPEPSPALLTELKALLQQSPAHSLMIWLCPVGSETLTAVYNPTLPELCGFQQFLTQGTISQVFLTGLPILESNLKDRPDHDPSLDELHQNSTLAMIAAPIASADSIIGVLSAVQFSGSTQNATFQIEHLHALTSLSQQLASEISAPIS